MRRVVVLSTPIVLVASFGVGCSGQIDQDGESDEGSAGSKGNGSTGGRGGSAGSKGSSNNPSTPAPPPTKTPDGKPLRVRNDALGLACDANAKPASSPLLRLTNREYENTLRDLLGNLPTPPSLPVEGQLDGFRNNAGAQAPSDLLIESLSNTADALAAVAFTKVVTCTPGDAGAERACLDGVLDGFGKRLFRRPLTDAEKGRFRTFLTEERASDDFKTSMTTLLSGLMQSPQFLYRVELGQGSGARRALTGHELASRLSYLIWDSMPDDALATAADKGELGAPEGVFREVDRLLRDARAKPAVADFTQQWINVAKLAEASEIDRKDRTTFPKYTDKTPPALQQGMDRFVEESLWSDGGGFKRLLTDARAFVSADSAWIYGATATGTAMTSTSLDATRRVGLLGQAAFLSGTGHEKLTGPILRGAFVLDKLLCASPPPPPPDVNVDVVKAAATDGLTNRERVQMTHAVGTCASCHRIIDPVGFTMEHFDAVGAWQDRDNGKAIDSTGKVDGTFDANGSFDGLPSLATKLSGSEQVAECVSANWIKYGLGRSLGDGDGCELASITEQMVASPDWSIGKLVAALATSPTFRTRIVEEP